MASKARCGEEFGEMRRRLVTDGVELSESSYGPREAVPSHYHARPQVCLVLEGAYEERYAGSSLSGEVGTALFHAPGEIHQNRFTEDGGVCFHVDLDPELLPAEAGEGAALETGFSRRTSPSWHAFLLRAELYGPDDVTTLAVEEAALAEEAGVHRVTVAQAFRRHYRCTAGEYVRQRRVEVAIRRLLDPAARLSAVAYHAGFADQPHLTRVFRRLVGTTPGAFQERMAHA